VISDPEARELVGRVGFIGRLELRDEVKSAMKTFVLYEIYSENAGVTCGQARASRWHKMKKSTVRLPPDDDILNHHLERTNFMLDILTYCHSFSHIVTYCQIHYDLLEHPFSIGHGWEFMNGKC